MTIQKLRTLIIRAWNRLTGRGGNWEPQTGAVPVYVLMIARTIRNQEGVSVEDSIRMAMARTQGLRADMQYNHEKAAAAMAQFEAKVAAVRARRAAEREVQL